MQSFKLLWSFSVFISASSGWVSISEFASFVGVPVGITSSVVGFKIGTLTKKLKKKNKLLGKRGKTMIK